MNTLKKAQEESTGQTKNITFICSVRQILSFGNLITGLLQTNLVLVISIDKTCYIIFKCIPDEICINHVVKLRGQPILKVDKSKYLGVIIDNELAWKAHIDYVYSKLLEFF